MKENKRLEFLRSIRLPSEETNHGKSGEEAECSEMYKTLKLDEYDLQKELERRFDELFGVTSEDD